MPLFAIESIDDPRLLAYRELKQADNVRRRELFVVEGDKLVERLLASSFEVVSVLCARRLVDWVVQRAAGDVSVLAVPDPLVEQIVGFNFHRGVLACGRRRPRVLLSELIASLEPTARGQRRTLVICPEIHDPENLGTIIRTSAALGVDAVVAGPRSADLFSRRMLRVSMGAVLKLPLTVVDDVHAALVELRDVHGYSLWATVLDDQAEPLDHAARPERLAVLLGSEGHGLSEALVAACQRRVTIPMHAGTDSLNVAVAAGIVLYQLMR